MQSIIHKSLVIMMKTKSYDLTFGKGCVMIRPTGGDALKLRTNKSIEPGRKLVSTSMRQRPERRWLI